VPSHAPIELPFRAEQYDSLANCAAESRNLLVLTVEQSHSVLSDTCDRMSDMASNRITVRVPQGLTARLRSRSRAKGTTESELVREALENYLENSIQGRTAYELAEEAGIVGMVRRAPKDLSTNRRHFKGFGQNK
jgi:predicted DNA-binding protein